MNVLIVIHNIVCTGTSMLLLSVGKGRLAVVNKIKKGFKLLDVFINIYENLY